MIILLFISFLWGTSFIFGKMLLDLFSAEFVTSMRFLLSLLIFSMIYFKKLKLTKSLIKRGSMIGAVNGVALLIQFIGLQYTTASNSAFLTATYVLYVPLLEFLFWKTKIPRKIIASAIISIIGVYFLSFPDLRSFSINKGDLITLICGFTFAFQIFLISHYTKKENIYGLAFMQFLISFLVSFIYFLFTYFTGRSQNNFEQLMHIEPMFNMLWLGIMCTLLPFALQFVAQKKVNPSVAGVVYLTEPVFAMFLSYIIFSETFTNIKIAGIILILIGVLITNDISKRGIRSGIRNLLKREKRSMNKV
ncbi:MAG: hypothetical protein CR982_10030 [Candidatus Cloacimonadota bacterium]|nr:MAG: hypothetical protein CR982_10030 [Candidatus Cloacimonadota bacterium]PIE79042.1 MAG: hypothetical protein CSA15_04680 [Candidatus Delongbacteria bacterium]